jgi:hypothetical protein
MPKSVHNPMGERGWGGGMARRSAALLSHLGGGGGIGLGEIRRGKNALVTK